MIPAKTRNNLTSCVSEIKSLESTINEILQELEQVTLAIAEETTINRGMFAEYIRFTPKSLCVLFMGATSTGKTAIVNHILTDGRKTLFRSVQQESTAYPVEIYHSTESSAKIMFHEKHREPMTFQIDPMVNEVPWYFYSVTPPPRIKETKPDMFPESKEILCVKISFPSPSIPEGVSLIDSPGLSNRYTDQVFDFIKERNPDVVFYLVGASGAINNGDIDNMNNILLNLSSKGAPLYIVRTMVDKVLEDYFDNEEDITEEQVVKWMEEICNKLKMGVVISLSNSNTLNHLDESVVYPVCLPSKVTIRQPVAKDYLSHHIWNHFYNSFFETMLQLRKQRMKRSWLVNFQGWLQQLHIVIKSKENIEREKLQKEIKEKLSCLKKMSKADEIFNAELEDLTSQIGIILKKSKDKLIKQMINIDEEDWENELNMFQKEKERKERAVNILKQKLVECIGAELVPVISSVQTSILDKLDISFNPGALFDGALGYGLLFSDPNALDAVFGFLFLRSIGAFNITMVVLPLTILTGGILLFVVGMLGFGFIAWNALATLYDFLGLHGTMKFDITFRLMAAVRLYDSIKPKDLAQIVINQLKKQYLDEVKKMENNIERMSELIKTADRASFQLKDTTRKALLKCKEMVEKFALTLEKN